MEAAARDLERFKGFKRLKAGKGRLERLKRAMQCRQTAGCSAGTAKAYDQRAWWKLPRGIWSVLRV